MNQTIPLLEVRNLSKSYIEPGMPITVDLIFVGNLQDFCLLEYLVRDHTVVIPRRKYS
jgi:hypothetical protein